MLHLTLPDKRGGLTRTLKSYSIIILDIKIKINFKLVDFSDIHDNSKVNGHAINIFSFFEQISN